MMNRRSLLGGAAVYPFAARAQQPPKPTILYLIRSLSDV